MDLTKENFAKTYPDCLVEYRPITGMNGLVLGIEVINDGKVDRVLGGIERRVDLARARKAGCKTAKEVCAYLNGQ